MYEFLSNVQDKDLCGYEIMFYRGNTVYVTTYTWPQTEIRYIEYSISILLSMIVETGYRIVKEGQDKTGGGPLLPHEAKDKREETFVLKVLLRVLGRDKGERRFVRREIGFCG